MLFIREQDPLKQGLKQTGAYIDCDELRIREQDPLKQGLKRNASISLTPFLLIREQDPLKQGLKLCMTKTEQVIGLLFESKIH